MPAANKIVCGRAFFQGLLVRLPFRKFICPVSAKKEQKMLLRLPTGARRCGEHSLKRTPGTAVSGRLTTIFQDPRFHAHAGRSSLSGADETVPATEKVRREVEAPRRDLNLWHV